MSKKRLFSGIARLAAIAVISSGLSVAPAVLAPEPAAASSVEIDRAIVLDGTSQQLETPDNFLGTNTPSQLTIALWMRYDAAAPVGNDTIFRLGYSTASRATLYIDDGQLAFVPFAESSGSSIYPGFTPKQGVWNHYAMVYDETNSANYSIYVNGQLIASHPSADISLATTTDNRRIFFGGYGQDYLEGQFDEIKIWTDGLTGAEIYDIMHSFGDGTGVGSAGVDDQNLVAYYNFNDSTANDVDTNGTTHNLEVIGTPTFAEVAQSSDLSNGTEKLITFPRSYVTSTGGWSPPPGLSTARVLLVGGGGGGVAGEGGGGGGGGVSDITNFTISSPTLTVIVGEGGLANQDRKRARNGGYSTFDSTSVPGGGGGGGTGDALGGADGASGGGGGGAGGGFTGSAGVTTFAQGNGGTGNENAGGGGGGAVANGGAAGFSTGGAGGAGKESNITNSTLRYAGGGGGGSSSSNSAGAAGAGGGGVGGSNTNPAGDGLNGLGGGGGGSAGFGDNLLAGHGGSGVVIVRYTIPTVPGQASALEAALRLDDADSDPDSVSLSWNAVTHSPSVTGYEVEYSTSADFSSSTTVSAASTTTTVSGLADGVTYYFRVRAVNVVGPGAWSESIRSIPVSILDNAITLDGIDDYLVRTEDTALRLGDFTLEFWFREDPGTTGSRDLVAEGKLLTIPTALNIRLSGDPGARLLTVEPPTGAFNRINVFSGVPQDEWVHFAYTYDHSASLNKFYINGSEVHSQVLANTSGIGSDSTGSFFIGRNYYGAEAYFKGQIDEVRLWSSVRDTDIATAMHQQINSHSDLVFAYDFNVDSGTTIHNRAGNSLDLAFSGNPTLTDVKTTTIVGPQTLVTFPRSYLSEVGGWLVPVGVSSIDALVVGGGGGGGGTGGRGFSGGGGAGGAVTETALSAAGSSFEVKVGLGGNGGSKNSKSAPGDFPQDGQGSQFGSVTSSGGGSGGHAIVSDYTPTDPSAPGLGGGGGAQSNSQAGGSLNSLDGGNGFGSSDVNLQAAGGGAGAGGDGLDAQSNTAGAGGPGVPSSISGSPKTYGGGGGGGKRRDVLGASAGDGGTGGGGAGGLEASGLDGQTGTGGGGGGGGGDSTATGGDSPAAGGRGGSGVVIIRYSQDRTLTLDSQGVTTTQVIPAGTTPSAPSVTRLGYKLLGWSDEQDNTAEYAANLSDFPMPDFDDTLYAVWQSDLVLALDITDTASYTSGSSITNLGTHSGNAVITTKPPSTSAITVVNQTWEYPSGNSGAYIDVDGTMSSNQFAAGVTIDFFAVIPQTAPSSGFWNRVLDFGFGNGADLATDSKNMVVTREGNTDNLQVQLHKSTANSAGDYETCKADGVLDGTLKRYTIVLSGSSCEFFVNGVSVSSVSSPNQAGGYIPAQGVNWDNLYVGRSNWDGGWAEGQLRYLRIFSSSLTPTQIDQIDSGKFTTKTVTLDANGGQLNSTPSSLVTSGTLSLPGSGPSRLGYSFAGWSTSVGGIDLGGVITPTADDVVYALWSAQPASAPTDLVLTSGNNSVGLSWTAPANPGPNLNDYKIEYQLRGANSWITFNDGVSTATTATVTGLDPNSIYNFRVSAINDGGTSAPSEVRSTITMAGLVSFLDASDTNSYSGSGSTWFDLTGNDNSVDSVGSPQFSPSGKHFELDGVSDRFSFGADTTKFNFHPRLNYTMSFTFSVDAIGSAQTLISRYNGGVKGSFYLEINSAGNLVGQREKPPYTVTGPTTLVAGQKYVATMVYDGTNLLLYLNGNLEISLALAEIASHDIETLLGSSQSQSSPSKLLDGKIFNSTVFVSALSASQVSALAQEFDTAPAAPTIDSIDESDGALSVNFTAGTNNGTSIAKYQYSTDGGITWRDRDSGSTSSPLDISTTSASNVALVNGTSYDIQIRAVNTLQGAASATVSATPLAPGLVPTFAAASQTVDGFTVSITNYDASFTWAVSSTAGAASLDSGSGVVTVTGLTPGQTATVTVSTSKTAFASGSYTVTASSISSFTLTLDDRGSQTTQSLNFGQTPPDPTSSYSRPGYTLSGWQDASDPTVVYAADLSDFTMPASNPTLVAVWTAGTNLITWDSNGGSSVSSPATFVTGGQIAEPADPVRAGYTFGGWSTSETSNNGEIANRISSWPYASPATADIVLYAIWLDELFLYEPLTGTAGAALNGIATSGSKGLTGNWSLLQAEKQGSDPAQDVALFSDGSLSFPANTSFSLPGSNTAAGSTSVWKLKYSARQLEVPISFDKDGTYYLSFLAKTTGLSMVGLIDELPTSRSDADDWALLTGVNFPKNITIDYGNANEAAWVNIGPGEPDIYSALSAAAKSATGSTAHLFVAKIETSASGNDKVSLRAFAPTEYIPVDSASVSWDVQYERAITGEAKFLTIQMEYESRVDEIRMGSTWLAATGALETYAVSYDPNGATAGSAPSSQTKIAGQDLTLATNSGSLERTGYTFVGWNTAADGNGTDYPAGATYALDAALPLFAKWQPNTYTITYTVGSVGSGANQLVTKTHDVALNLADASQANSWFTRAGYAVSGWATSDLGPLVYQLGQTFTVEGNTTLYPVWVAATYVVPASGDTYVVSGTGSNSTFGSSSALLLKNAGNSIANSFNRVAFMEFSYDPSFIWAGGVLEVVVSGNFDGAINNGYNITYTSFNLDIYGANDASWDESTLSFNIANSSNQGWGLNTGVYPWNPDNAVYLGTISIPTDPATVGQTFALATQQLDDFLNGDTDGNVTFYMRRSDVDHQANLSIATNEHPSLAGPRLTVAEPGYSYTIAYDINGGTGSVPAPGVFIEGGSAYTILSGSTVVPPASKTFAGWNTKADGNGTDYAPGDSYSANRSVTLYAKFVDFPRAIFKSNYQSGPQDVSQIITPNTATSLRLNSFSRTGYSFAGWDTLPGGGGTAYADGDSVTITSDLELFAQWTPNTYQILYQYNGADGSNGTSSDTYQTDDPALVLPTPTRTGYNFGGWYSNIALTGSPLGASIQPVANSTLYAKWNAINYSITYLNTDSDAGAIPTDSSSYIHQQSATVRANTGNLARTGYRFAGWVLDPTDPNEIPKNAGQTITFGAADITLHPKWEPETYTITYHSNGATSGSPVAPSEPYTTGQGLLSLPGAGTLDKPGYTFGGWSDQPSNGSQLPGILDPNADLDLYAIWNVTDYYFVYDLNGGSGSGVATQTGDVERSLTISAEGDAQKTGHWFGGWNTAADGSGDAYAPGTSVRTPIGGLNLYAIWVPNNYKIHYNANGGSGGPNLPNGFDTATDGIAYNILDKGDLARPGYNFSHWSKVSSGAGDKYDQNPNGVDEQTSFIASGNTTLFAQWTPISYTLLFDVVGGSATIGPQPRTIGQNFTMPSAGTKSGYTFLHWSDGSVNYPSGSTFTVGTSSKVFTAVWKPNTYTITYDWQGGSTSGTAQVSDPYTVGNGAMVLPDGTGYERDGFTFDGWSETPGGNPVSGYQPQSSRVLYALWQSGNFNLTYDVNTQGQPAGSAAVPRGTTTVLPLPVREGFVFAGWFDSETNGVFVGNAGDSYTPTASGMLHANWVQRSLFGVDLAQLETGANIAVGSGGSGGSITVNHAPTNTSASVTVPNGSLPAGTNITARYFREIDRQADIIPGDNNYIFSLLVSWMLGSGDSATVPDTDPNLPIEVTMTSSAIKAGQMIYQLIGDQYTELGRASQDGTLTVFLTEDPEIVVAATAPETPSVDNVTIGMSSATVEWSAPVDGGSPITSYTVTSNPGGFSCVTVDTSCTITGLTADVDYTFTVSASNSVGDSADSAASNPVAPAPTVYTVTFDSNGGNAVTDGSFQAGGSVSPPINPTRSGYNFLGWTTVLDDENTLVTFPYAPGVDNNITLFALWAEVPVVITPPVTTTPGPAAGIEAVSGQTRAWTKRISATEVKVYIKFPEMGSNYQIRLQKNNGEYVRLMSKTVNTTASDALLVVGDWYYLVRTIELPGDGRYRIEVTQDGERISLNGKDRPVVYTVIPNML